MICSDEVRVAIQKTFELPKKPTPTSSWEDQRYTCTYQVRDAPLQLTVVDDTDAATGAAHYAAVRQALTGATLTDLTGAPALGFPAFQTAKGHVGFLKDGKTLLVDASRLPPAALPANLPLDAAAYAVAAAVISCWTEK